MMDILFREVQILDPQSTHHKKVRNVHIKNGKIASIGSGAPKSSKIINGKGLKVVPGLLDMRANFHDPGMEHKEDIGSGCHAAELGGFTGVVLLPNTDPVIQTKSHVEYIISKGRTYLPDVYPMAAITLDAKGESLTEMIDLHHAGAVAFTDGDQSSWHTDIMLKSLIYVQKFEGLVINRPEDTMLTKFGDMHEGEVSTALGLKGMPSLAEEIMIKRDLDLLAYTGGKLHLSNISSKGAVTLIKEAKRKKLNVTCDTSIHHLLFDDTQLGSYDTNFKSNPPFRSQKDRNALINAVKEGTIDVIVTSHTPQDQESKKLEFDLACFGLIGLQTFIPGIELLKDKLPLDSIISSVTQNPRRILGLPEVKIEEGEVVNMTIIDPNEKWSFDEHTNGSKSINSPLFDQVLEGKSLGVINGSMHYFDKSLTSR